MINQRHKISPPKKHLDFEWKRGMPKGSRKENNKHWVSLKAKIDSGYFDFAICFWGAIGKTSIPDSNGAGSVFYIKETTPGVRELMESIDWPSVDQVSAGAPQITSDVLIDLYSKAKSLSENQ